MIGSGPNGLATAITLAQAGLPVRILEATGTVGGGLRSTALTRPGFVHDVCSAVHPLAVSSPFFCQLPLEKFGLEWVQPDIPLAHPLDNGSSACLHRSLDSTARNLGRDATAYAKLMRPFVRHWKALASEFLQPILHVPRHPITLTRFGSKALFSAQHLAFSHFKEATSRALFAGIAGHSFLPLDNMMSAAFGLVLGAAGHAVGWPIPRGGSQRIADALAGYFRELGGKIELNRPVRNWNTIPKHRVVFFDVTAWLFEQIAGPRLPSRYRRQLSAFRHAPGICKIDYALDGPIPWKAETCRRAGTVHVGGSFEEIARAEREVAHGRHPERPFVLVAQSSVFDEHRAPPGKHTLWAYCHVPHGSTFDMSGRIESQIERFAPGFRDSILERHVMKSPDLEERNPSLIGGDISGGANSLRQLIARPVFRWTPYRTPISDAWLCSSSTPPGGGVHGMCGYNAATAWLRTNTGR